MTSTSKSSVVQYCSSREKRCGIATYTAFLAKAQNMPVVSNVRDLHGHDCTHVHVQHEFGAMELKELKNVHRHCKSRRKRFIVTMHTVIPQPGFLRFFLHRFLGVRGAAGGRSQKLWLWDEDNPDYGIRAYMCYRRAQRFIVRHADTVVVHGEEARVALEDMGAKRIEVVPHGIQDFPTSQTLLSKKDGKLHVGCFGHVNPGRGLLHIIKACSRIKNVHLHIHASAEMTDEHDAYLREVRGAVAEKEWITLDTSHAPLEEIVFRLSQYDVNVWYCNTPGGISASGSVCQYVAAKRPIVASATVMVADLADAVTLVPPMRPDWLATALVDHSPDTTRLKELCDERAWKEAHPSYGTQHSFPSFRSHFLHHDTRKQQRSEMQESIRHLRALCQEETQSDLHCTNLTELHPRFLRDPLVAYNHEYTNGNPEAARLQKTLLFLHLQKTGGTTLTHIMRRNVQSIGLRLDFSGQPNINPAFLGSAYDALPPERKREERVKWSRYDVLANHFGYGVHRIIEGPYAYVTMLRDPVARLLSYYRNLQQQPPVSWIGSKTYADRAASLSFREFVQDPFFRRCIVLGHSSTQMLAGTRDEELTQAHLHRAKRHLRSFEAVLLTEEFAKSVEILCALYGWKAEIFDGVEVQAWEGQRLGRETGSDGARAELSDEDIALIEELLHEDMELYRYAQELFTKQYAEYAKTGAVPMVTALQRRTTLKHMVEHAAFMEPPSPFALRVFQYMRRVVRIPTNLAKIAEQGVSIRRELQSEKFETPAKLDKLYKLEKSSFGTEQVVETLQELTHHVDTVTDRITDSHMRLNTMIDRLYDQLARWDVFMDRTNDITTHVNGIAYNMNEVIASLEAIADELASGATYEDVRKRAKEEPVRSGM